MIKVKFKIDKNITVTKVLVRRHSSSGTTVPGRVTISTPNLGAPRHRARSRGVISGFRHFGVTTPNRSFHDARILRQCSQTHSEQPPQVSARCSIPFGADEWRRATVFYYEYFFFQNSKLATNFCRKNLSLL